MNGSSLQTVSPLDGRYAASIQELRPYFSEFALIKTRLHVEIMYLLFLSKQKEIFSLSAKEKDFLKKIDLSFDEKEAQEVKKIERKTHHDIKAIEYYLQSKCRKTYPNIIPYIHLALTSEDINSIAYSLLIKRARDSVIVPTLKELIDIICDIAEKEKKTVMLARTHGQPAVTTTLGKECMVYAMRLYNLYVRLQNEPIEAKLTGAVGNFNAHVAAYPNTNWIKLSRDFILSLGLKPNVFTTQILPPDSYLHVFQSIELINSILIGFNQDIWRYISDDYFVLHSGEDEVGSSTMPQKVNPIDFENSEGNLGIANSLLHFFSEKLPISRLQRDLSDSTVKRNFGSAFGYSLLGYKSCINGLSKLSANRKKINADLEAHWEVVTEGIQTLLRTTGDQHAYEKLKIFAKGKRLDKKDLSDFIKHINVSEKLKKKMLELSPFSYYGLADTLVAEGLRVIKFSPKRG